MADWWDKPLTEYEKSVTDVLLKKYGYRDRRSASQRARFLLIELENARTSFKGVKPSAKHLSNSRIRDALFAMGNRALREFQNSKDNPNVGRLKQDAQIMMEIWKELKKKSPVDIQMVNSIQDLDNEMYQLDPKNTKRDFQKRRLTKTRYEWQENIDDPHAVTKHERSQREVVEGLKTVNRPDSKKYKPVKISTSDVSSAFGKTLEKGISQFTEADIEGLEERAESFGEYADSQAEYASRKNLKVAKADYTGKSLKIISGGQTGADFIGLQMAKELGLETGGTAPPHFIQSEMKEGKWAKIGKPELLKSFGLTEGKGVKKTGKYGDYTDVFSQRTEQNVLNSDLTLIYTVEGEHNSAGTKATRNFARKHGKKFLQNPTPEEIKQYMRTNEVTTINIAGNRPYEDAVTIKQGLQSAQSVFPIDVSEQLEAPVAEKGSYQRYKKGDIYEFKIDGGPSLNWYVSAVDEFEGHQLLITKQNIGESQKSKFVVTEPKTGEMVIANEYSTLKQAKESLAKLKSQLRPGRLTEHINRSLAEKKKPPTSPSPEKSTTKKVVDAGKKILGPIAKSTLKFVVPPVGVYLTMEELAQAHQRVVERNESGGRSRDYAKSGQEFRRIHQNNTPFHQMKNALMELGSPNKEEYERLGHKIP